MLEWAQLLGGGVLLYFGAAWFVGGATSLALLLLDGVVRAWESARCSW